MQIDYYEEFPTKNNLQKLKLIKYRARLFLASDSIKKYEKLKKQVKKINPKIKTAYWPIIPNSYWISPFSNTKDLINLFNNLKKIKDPVLIDLEPPLKNKILILKNIFSFFKNKRLIKEFLEKNKNRITTAQFPYTARPIYISGLNYKIKTEKTLMNYSSMVPKPTKNYIKKILKNIKNKKDYSISLGVIAKGILGNEKILSTKELKKDLEFIKKIGFRKVIIFRLGGLNKQYMNIINKFQKNN